MVTETHENLITVEITGNRHRVPAGLSVLGAMWYTGLHMTRGVGCMSGVCGACATVYRRAGDFALNVGLGCQMRVEDGMSFAMTPFYPAPEPGWRIGEVTRHREELFLHFPEALNCRNCNACNKVCPQELDIKGAVRDAVRGDFAAAADKAEACINCGLCVSRCIAEMAPNKIAHYARRTFAAFEAPGGTQLEDRMAEVESGRWTGAWAEVLGLDEAGLKAYCAARR